MTIEEIINVKDQYYVLATSSLADDRTRVLKNGETFAVFDRQGNIQRLGLGEQGIYHEGTRYLSRLALSLNGVRPFLLSSTQGKNDTTFVVSVMNPDTYVGGEVTIPRGTLYLSRSKFLWNSSCYEQIVVSNFGSTPIEADIGIQFDADFADIFEVRGFKREKRGKIFHEINHEKSIVSFRYVGLDGVARTTRIESSIAPKRIGETEMHFRLLLQPKEEAELSLTISFESKSVVKPVSIITALEELAGSLENSRKSECEVYSSNDQFNEWMNRSVTDIQMMSTDTPHGIFPYAGVPWYSTAFGRDGIITALETLWLNPDIARGVLSYLAATQAKHVNAEQDAEPGKILHETRLGEMASLKEIPFGQYYGSVDATPLFVCLAGAYYFHTGDSEFIDRIWPNIERALHWIDKYGDVDGDGFVEYVQRSPTGLINQGWKDSHDSIFHADGTLVTGPVALCEVQGYVFLARQMAARMALARGKRELANRLHRQAEDIQVKFEHAFWSDELSMYAIALDGEKMPCLVRSSNAGQTLFSGIAAPERAARIRQALLGKEMFSGWGIRTIGTSEPRYNPMSYHNGSIWPHDNAMIALGLAQYGYKDSALKLFAAMFDTSVYADLHRLPELFCGFRRQREDNPIQYPVACAPQAWAAGSIFMLLQSCLGMTVNGIERRVNFTHPALPEWLQKLRIKNLRVGKSTVDLELHRLSQVVGVDVTRRDSDVEVIVVSK